MELWGGQDVFDSVEGWVVNCWMAGRSLCKKWLWVARAVYTRQMPKDASETSACRLLLP